MLNQPSSDAAKIAADIRRYRGEPPTSALPPSEPQGGSERSRLATGWGHLSERTQKRLEEMIACGVPRATAELTAEVMWTLGADSIAWSIFADLEADPPTLQLYNPKTGAHIECSNLGGPNTKMTHAVGVGSGALLGAEPRLSKT